MTTTAQRKGRETAFVPVTTMEELPLPSESERAEMLASLKAAEARIAGGDYVAHNPESFVEELVAIRAAALAAKTA